MTTKDSENIKEQVRLLFDMACSLHSANCRSLQAKANSDGTLLRSADADYRIARQECLRLVKTLLGQLQ